MNEIYISLGIILLVIAIASAIVYLVLRVTKYYKQKFGIKMGPTILMMCLAFDLLVVASLLYGNGGDEQWILIFNCASLVVFGCGMWRNIKYYKMYTFGALGIQLLFTIAQFVVLLAVLITLLIRRLIKRQNDQMRMILGWTKLLLNM